jgi:RNA-directed DNA polymerase
VTTENRGRKTPGIDNKTYHSNIEKIKLVSRLKIDGKSNHVKRVYIPKYGKMEKRPLGIPTIKDRAKQALVLIALEPEWEAKFEPNSYGFRPGRSCHDAVVAIF